MTSARGTEPGALYGAEFFASLSDMTRSSADVVVPMLVDTIAPRSVVDVGCGTGTWLSAFVANGVDDVIGVDGPHVPLDRLEIDTERFFAADLREPWSVDRRFDLALCLEVGEHLPEERAPTLVDALVLHAPVVLFSAAIPHQGGAGHVNERWPEWWATLFAQRGYRAVDWLRPLVWDDTRVAFYYAQNAVLYIDESRSDLLSRLDGATEPRSLVHPALYLRERTILRRSPPPSLRHVLRLVPGAVVRTVRRRARIGGHASSASSE